MTVAAGSAMEVGRNGVRRGEVPAPPSPPRDRFDESELAALIAAFGEGAIPAELRREALRRSPSLPVPGPQPGRYWKTDLRRLDLGAIAPFAASQIGEAAPVSPEAAGADTTARFVQVGSVPAAVAVAPAARAAGVIVCDLATARRDHPGLLERALFAAVGSTESKFVAIATAFQTGGAFVHVPDGVRLDDPVRVVYAATPACAQFPRTVVLAGARSEFTVIEELTTAVAAAAPGDAPLAAGAGRPLVTFVAAVTEVLAGDGARVTHAVTQAVADGATVLATRRAKLGRAAFVHWAIAELGGELAVSTVDAVLDQPGAEAQVSGLFFADRTQHVDLTTELTHRVGETRSETLFKGAGIARGQARFLGNIRIEPRAHGSDASLRDDTLLLSPTAHVDSVPALEIAANDVKAFHGATVGAIDEEQLFYVMSRGVARVDAERMIALGFFSPAIDRFPTEALRAQIARALETKIAATAAMTATAGGAGAPANAARTA